MTSGDKRRDDLDTELERVTRAYRDLPEDEPPAAADQAVLSRARRAVARRSVRPWNFGWIHAVSTAALLVLGVALVMQRPEAPDTEPLRVSKPPSNELAAPRKRQQTLQVPAPAEVKPGQDSAVTRELRAAADRAPAGETPQQGEAEEEDAPAAEARRAPVAASLGDAAISAKDEDTSVRAQAAAGRAAMEQAGEPEAGEGSETDPEAWLQRILALQRSGDTAAFEAELAAFRTAWPDYPLPDELTR